MELLRSELSWPHRRLIVLNALEADEEAVRPTQTRRLPDKRTGV
jgi:hypothetical protein